MIAAIDHKRAIRISSLTFLTSRHQSLKKTGRCREVILVVGDSWGHALVGVAV